MPRLHESLKGCLNRLHVKKIISFAGVMKLANSEIPKEYVLLIITNGIYRIQFEIILLVLTITPKSLNNYAT